jgi:hypothetical protein
MPPSGNAPTAANTPEKVAAKKALAKKAMARKEAANLPDPIVRIRRMDKDGDGVISREEWVGQLQGFNRADTNSDGKLDAEEQSRAAEIMKRFIEAAKKKAQDN